MREYTVIETIQLTRIHSSKDIPGKLKLNIPERATAKYIKFLKDKLNADDAVVLNRQIFERDDESDQDDNKSEWEKCNIGDDLYRCVKCKQSSRQPWYGLYPYCPHCGRRMLEVVRDED